MSRINVYSRGRNVGWAEYSGMDAGFGNVVATFRPSGAYSEIQAIVRESTRLRAQRRNDDAFRVVQRQYDALGLMARSESGGDLRPSGGVLIEDHADQGECRLTLVGLSPLDREKLL